MVRLTTPSDSVELHSLQCRLDAQSAYMLLEPGERAGSETLRERLAGQGPHGSFDLVADDETGHAIGWLSIEVLPFARASHVGYIVLGVDADSAGRGTGRALLKAALAEGRARGLRRLELTVMTDNVRALRLYLACGFQVEGLRRRAVRRAGTLVDEYYMSCLLDSSSSERRP